MDTETYEQVEIPVSHVEWELNFLKEGMIVKIRKYKEEILDIELECQCCVRSYWSTWCC